MPIVKEIKGDLVELFKEGKHPLIAHPVMCTETLTTKFAKDLAESFEDVAKVQKEFPLPAIYRLGDYSVVPTEAGTVLNFYTQLNLNTSYEYCALKNCLKKLSMEAMNAGTYIELAIVVNEVGNLDYIKKILNVQESLLITIVHHDKGQVSVGEGQVE